MLVAVALLAGGWLAGCVASPDVGTASTEHAVVSDSWALQALASGEGHNHQDPKQHANLTTPNFRVVGYAPLDAKGHPGTGGWDCGEIGVTKEGRKLAVTNSFTSDVVFVLVDVTDPANPFQVGEMVMPEGHAYDVAMTPDGKHVVIAQNNLRKGVVAPALPLAAPTFRDACGATIPMDPNDLLSALPGVVLVNVEDPAKPRIVDGFFAGSGGPHSVSTSRVDNVTYVIASVLESSHQASYFEFFTVEGDALKFQSAYQAPPAASGKPPPLFNAHNDATIQRHPLTKQLLAYLADWNAGLIVVDITVIQAPMMLSSFSEAQSPTAFIDPEGDVHAALPIEGLWEGKHYVLASQELTDKPKTRPSGWVYILDDTDPANLKLAGRWTLPVDQPWNGYLAFSLHYMALVNRTLFVSAYHAGVWAADLSTPEKIAQPPTLGVFLADRAPPNPPKIEGNKGVPNTEEILAQPDGTLLTFDSYSGAYTLRFDPTVPVPALPAWTSAHK